MPPIGGTPRRHVCLQARPLKKSIYSLHTLRELMLAANMRYLEFISTLDDPQDGIRSLDKVTRPVRHNGRSYKGLPLLSRR